VLGATYLTVCAFLAAVYAMERTNVSKTARAVLSGMSAAPMLAALIFSARLWAETVGEDEPWFESLFMAIATLA